MMKKSPFPGIRPLLLLGGILLGNPIAARAQGDSLSAKVDSLFETLKADLEDLASRQEVYYTRNYTYSADFGGLGFTPSDGVVVVLDVTNDGWRARATHSDLGEGKGCAFYYGAIAPPTSPVTPTVPGEVICSGLPEPRAQADPGAETVRVYPVAEVPEPAELGELLDGPVFTPYTLRPDITNRSEVARAVEREYPPLLRDAGTGGRARVWFLIDAKGVVRKLQINEGSGHPALDEAAIRVAQAFRFTPARNRGKPVPVWISIPITFTPR